MHSRFSVLAALFIASVEAFASGAQAPMSKRIKLSEIIDEVSIEDEIRLEGLKPLIDLSSEGNQQAQEQILSYFSGRELESDVISVKEKDFIDQLALEKWAKYLEEYNVVFVHLCILKADGNFDFWRDRRQKAGENWILPEQVEDQLLFHTEDLSVDVQSRLGEMYDVGEGVEQDDAQALNWMHRAADQGGLWDQFQLAKMYAEGDMVEKNYDQAIKWFLKVAHSEDGAIYRGDLDNFFLKNENFSKNDSSYAKTLTDLEAQVQNLYGAHILEAHINDPEGRSNTGFKEKGLAIPLLHKHYQVLAQFEVKVLNLIKGFSLPGLMIDSWDLADNTWFQAHRGAERYFEEYSFNNHRYVTFGKEAVEHSNLLMAFLSGEDEDWQSAIKSVKFLKKVFGKIHIKLAAELIDFQDAARASRDFDQRNLQEFEMLNKRAEVYQEHLDGLEALEVISHHLAHLLCQGAHKRNEAFKEEYPNFS